MDLCKNAYRGGVVIRVDMALGREDERLEVRRGGHRGKSDGNEWEKEEFY